MKILILTIFLNLLIIPQVHAESVFSDKEEEVITQKDESYVASFFGGDKAKAQNAQWGKFKKLEDYGQSSDTTYSDPNQFDPAEAAALSDYQRSKDPFSNDNRLQNVQNLLSPPENNQIDY